MNNIDPIVIAVPHDGDNITVRLRKTFPKEFESLWADKKINFDNETGEFRLNNEVVGVQIKDSEGLPF